MNVQYNNDNGDGNSTVNISSAPVTCQVLCYVLNVNCEPMWSQCLISQVLCDPFMEIDS